MMMMRQGVQEKKGWTSYLIPGVIALAVIIVFVYIRTPAEAELSPRTNTHIYVSAPREPRAAGSSGDYLPVARPGCNDENNVWKYGRTERLSFITNMYDVPGWMEKPVPYITAVLAQYQRSIGVCGDIGEIGVHRGLYGIGLCHTMIPSEKYIAADIFDMDIGHNTAGDLFRENTVAAFQNNLAKFAIKEGDYLTKRADSTKLKPEDLNNDKIGPFRFFSVDGGHAREVVTSDMILVSQIIVEGAIVAMDDWDAPGWDGIREGFITYWTTLTERDIPLVPLLHGFNKMLVTTPSHHQIYYDFLANHPVLKHKLTSPIYVIEGPWKYLKIWDSTIEEAWKELIESTSLP